MIPSFGSKGEMGWDGMGWDGLSFHFFFCTCYAKIKKLKHHPTFISTMARFGTNVFRGKKEQELYDKSIAGRYSKLVKKNHFLYLGLPFLLSIVAGSIYLQKFTSVKWERYDEKHRQLDEEEMLEMIENKRKVNKKDDYYRLLGLLTDHLDKVKDDYEIKRIHRKKEDEPVWWRK